MARSLYLECGHSNKESINIFTTDVKFVKKFTPPPVLVFTNIISDEENYQWSLQVWDLVSDKVKLVLLRWFWAGQQLHSWTGSLRKPCAGKSQQVLDGGCNIRFIFFSD